MARLVATGLGVLLAFSGAVQAQTALPTPAPALALAPAAPLPAQSQRPSQESIERLLLVAQAEKMLEGIKPQLQASIKAMSDQALKGKTVTPAQQKILDTFYAKAASAIEEELSMDKLKPFYIAIYADTFSQAEVDGMTAFYETAVGQSMMTKMPIVIQKTMAQMPQWMAPMTGKIEAIAKEMRTQMDEVSKEK